MNDLLLSSLVCNYKRKIDRYLAEADKHIFNHRCIAVQLRSNRAEIANIRAAIANAPDDVSGIVCLLAQLNLLELSVIQLTNKIELAMLTTTGRLGSDLDELRSVNKRLCDILARDSKMASCTSLNSILVNCQQDIEAVYHRLICYCGIEVGLLKIIDSARKRT